MKPRPGMSRHLVAIGVSVCLAVLTTALPSSAGASEASYTSIFTATDPRFSGAGWSSCSGPIPWSLDTSHLSPRQARTLTSDIRWALDQWSQASDLDFVSAGPAAFTYDDTSFSLRSDRRMDDRGISLAFVPQGSSTRLSSTVVGLGSPSAVLASSNEVTRGTAVFSADYFRTASRREARAVVLHELGHVLGLGHTGDADQVMAADVQGRVTLGTGDVAGIRALTRTCVG